jgi:Putative metallopeptidase
MKMWLFRTLAIVAALLWVTASGISLAQTPPAPSTPPSSAAPTAPASNQPRAPGPMPFTRDEFLVANIVHTVWHEFGHALISLFNIPVLGREEDAVDDLATLLILRAPDRAAGVRMLEAVGWGWYLSFAGARGERPAYWAEHSLDLQRLYAIACLVYGSDPARNVTVADRVRLPPERRESCVEDYQQRLDSWQRVMARFLVTPPRASRRSAVHGAQGPRNRARVSVLWREPRAEFRELAAVLRRSGMIEAMARDIGQRVRLPRSIRLRIEHCDEPNAFWDADQHAVITCYEFLAFTDRLYREHQSRQVP